MLPELIKLNFIQMTDKLELPTTQPNYHPTIGVEASMEHKALSLTFGRVSSSFNTRLQIERGIAPFTLVLQHHNFR